MALLTASAFPSGDQYTGPTVPRPNRATGCKRATFCAVITGNPAGIIDPKTGLTTGVGDTCAAARARSPVLNMRLVNRQPLKPIRMNNLRMVTAPDES